jgi:UDP-glucuronate 4-epimerase
MTYLVTGAAGFIGYHCCRALLERGDTVVGVDNLDPYYSVALKRARLRELGSFGGFAFLEIDMADREALSNGLAGRTFARVIHLAAQAGVRHSLVNPAAYVSANLVGHFNLLEYCRLQDPRPTVVYASSSSVYGGSSKLPYSEDDRVDMPVSFYAATKRADELMSHTYAQLYGLSLTGLRFFTVYGPWGRPDMAVWLFAEAILAGRPIGLFNHGRMRRDFTYIDDVVAGVLAVSDRPPDASPPHRVYNIGGSRPEALHDMIALLETALGRKAETKLLPMQPGEVVETYADIGAIARDYGFRPTATIEVGIPKFVAWFRDWRKLGLGQ